MATQTMGASFYCGLGRVRFPLVAQIRCLILLFCRYFFSRGCAPCKAIHNCFVNNRIGSAALDCLIRKISRYFLLRVYNIIQYSSVQIRRIDDNNLISLIVSLWTTACRCFEIQSHFCSGSRKIRSKYRCPIYR